MIKTLIVLFITLFGLAGCQATQTVKINTSTTVTTSTTASVTTTTVPNIRPSSTSSTKPVVATKPESHPTTTPIIKAQINYPVPFTSQAPYQVWDELHEEACEETAMLMAVAYYQQQSLTSHQVEQDLLKLIDWEAEQGYRVDVTAAETAKILKDYFKLSATVRTDVTVASIKAALTAGDLVLLPTAGRLLGNPNFTAPGPIYHMLIVRGYTSTHFIVNDPGTRRGQAYQYDYATLLNAIHDWNHERAIDGMTDEEMVAGQRAMIVVSGTRD